jgi:hypothetical protein
MVVGSQSEIVTVKDYQRLCQENEYFFWHFVANNPDMITTIKPVTDIVGKTFESPLNEIQESLNVKIYESLVEDSVDFLMNLGYKSDQIFQKACNCFAPKFIGFRKGAKVAGTASEVKCYCTEGVVEVIYLTNPLLFE